MDKLTDEEKALLFLISTKVDELRQLTEKEELLNLCDALCFELECLEDET